MKYDVIIIGAGLSGLAAGIRLAHYGKTVYILERHNRIGGLNSYFSAEGRRFDVGLHAMTNFTPRDQRRSPLNKLLRQLRIPRDELQLCEHRKSIIQFPGCILAFSNDPEVLRSQIAAAFPREIDGFDRLVAEIRDFTPGRPSGTPRKANSFLDEFIRDERLKHMIRCPVMYYGNATPTDMDWDQFRIMFQAVFLEGFCKPKGGIRTLLNCLRRRFTDNGGELSLNTEVAAVEHENGRVSGVTTTDGRRLQADAVLSCAGYPETLRLTCPSAPCDAPPGDMAFLETIFVLETHDKIERSEEAIAFYNDQDTFRFAPPPDLIDPQSAVVCFPDNFAGIEPVPREMPVRITRIANFAKWFALQGDEYEAAKMTVLERQLELLELMCPGARAAVVFSDTFTPKTIHRYTARLNGAIYGSPVKHPDGRTPLENLFICGTDQGFVGITGSILSGIGVANQHLL